MENTPIKTTTNLEAQVFHRGADGSETQGVPERRKQLQRLERNDLLLGQRPAGQVLQLVQPAHDLEQDGPHVVEGQAPLPDRAESG